MKRIVVIFLILLMGFGIWSLLFDSEPKIVAGTEATATAVVTDRAMSDNMPYLSVQFPGGSGLCLWDPQKDVIPEDVAIGDTIEVTYGKQDGIERYILISVKMDTA